MELRATVGSIASFFVQLIGDWEPETSEAAASALIRLAEYGTLHLHAMPMWLIRISSRASWGNWRRHSSIGRTHFLERFLEGDFYNGSSYQTWYVASKYQ